MNLYELLEVKRNATKEEIKNAYRSMVKKYHPDINQTEEAKQMMVRLNEAKETLLNEQKRSTYDKSLESISNIKQKEKEENKTNYNKTPEQKEKEEEIYITKWAFFMEYCKKSPDNILKKCLKSIVIFLNAFLFTTIKSILFCIVFLIAMLDEVIDYLVGIIILVAIFSFFALIGATSPDYLPLLPANIEQFLILTSMAVGIEMLKVLILEKSYNLFTIFQNIENKIFTTILIKT